MQRLQQHAEGKPLPPYADILYGPQRLDCAALEARAEELAELCMREPGFRARAAARTAALKRKGHSHDQ
jgi:hypothetical protein